MQDFFFVGIISAISLKTSNEIIDRNLQSIKVTNHQTQQIQKTMSSIENVVDWRYDDPRALSDDLKQQFLTKSRSRRMPASDRASPRGRIPLATTDFDELSEDDTRVDSVPIYTYNPSFGGTQV